MPPHPVHFALDPDRRIGQLVFFMVWLAGMLVILDVGLHHSALLGPDLAGWFDATSERGLGSWVSVTQTVLLALTLWAVAAVAGQVGGRRRALGWAVAAACVSYLALDDGTMLHERVGSAFADTSLADDGVGGAFPSYYWQLVLGPVFAGMGLFLGVFLWRALGERRLRALVAGAFGLLAAAVALDFVDGLGEGHPANVYAWLSEATGFPAYAEPLFAMSGYDAVVHFSRALEESLEIAAMTLLWAAVLFHLARLTSGVTVRWAPAVGGDGAASDAPALAREIKDMAKENHPVA